MYTTKDNGRRRCSIALLGITVALLLATALVPTAGASAPTCDGKTVTVDMNLGQQPTSGDDVILGTPGNDTISAGAGNDTVCAGHGNDAIYGQGGNDRIWGGSGKDRIFGGNGHDVISGLAGHDVIRGGNGHDQIWGGAGDDTIEGEAGRDKLYGGNGDDVLVGGLEADQANGGDGTDDCDAETEVACEAPSVPAWVAGSTPKLESLSQFHIEVSWCCSLGGAATPDIYEITITNSRGETDFAARNASSDPWSYRLDSFGGYALEPGVTYSIDIVAVNAAGRSQPIGVDDLGVLEFETTTYTDGGSPGSASLRGSSIRNTRGFHDNECLRLSTVMNMKQNIRFRTDNHVTFELQTDACVENGVFDKNLATRSCVITRGSARLDTDLLRTPDGDNPQSTVLHNQAGCGIESEATRTIGIDITYRGVGLTQSRTEAVIIDATMTLQHYLEVWGAGICWQSIAAPVSQGGDRGEDCPEPSYTG